MKKYRDEHGNEIIVFEKNEKRENLPKIPPARFPFWSTYIPVVPCVYDGALTILEQISKLYHYANKLKTAIEQNHDDIITLGERVDGVEISLENILSLIGDLPKFVVVEFRTNAQPITADRTFAEVLAEYQAGSIIIGRASADNALYIATVGDENAIVFLTSQRDSNVTLTMTPATISQTLTRYLTTGGGTVTGTLNILNAPVSELNAANKLYVDSKAAAEAATAAGDAIRIANANAIDMVNVLKADIEANYLPLAGGTMIGQIIQPAMPTESRNLVNKRYVDLAIGESTRYIVGAESKIGEWVENEIVYAVYRKVINFGALPNAGEKSMAHEIENVTRFISARGLATSASNNLEIPMVSANGTNNIYLAVGNARVTIGTSTDRSNFTACYIELKFIRPQPSADIDREIADMV